jgi:lipid II:glycine glycyltransferase (peptidoglycan interpeptide bridge formation enzyme)
MVRTVNKGIVGASEYEQNKYKESLLVLFSKIEVTRKRGISWRQCFQIL